ncbi:type VII secretion integral membrane protein EccD [Saccharothrix syringae]|uniref:Type VII secretion integral membrane protein EccD n=1 Tax=Saccharothrix syringae TaxID=103733 RepID=A0A5Q0GXB7_SACSY|nr:type VII secretion integral membrane protein EccD [Saccharothrix syringae]QFZ18581.1 type VII secretion integral membrane protein EccD [Saccharothrix syringae]
MTAAAELCRITVVGPGGRADLAVPVATTLADLIPTLVEHVVPEEQRTANAEYGAWVLQRLGEAPLDPDGTPETLDWLDGDRFHLVPARDPLPELDFDDVAEGMATAISRQGDRWSDTANRRLFLGLAAVALATIGAALATAPDTTALAATAAALALVLLTATVVVARTSGDRALAAVAGTSGCGFAWLSGVIGLAGADRAFTPLGALVGAVAALACGVLPLVLQRLVVRDLPVVPFGVVVVAAAGAVLAGWLHLGLDLDGARTAAVTGTALFLLTLFTPKLATRAARLRGPQLPRTAEELQIDVEPEPAADLVSRTGQADRYLTMLAVGAALVFAAVVPGLLADAGWAQHVTLGLLTALVLLRSREFRNVVQRTALVLTGAWGVVAQALVLAAALDPVWRITGLAGLLGVAALLVTAALRPLHRRPLPLWGHLANVLELCAGVAVLPVLLQILGVYAWARGLAG